MKSYVVFTKDDKEGVLYPTVVGPFRSHTQLERFLAAVSDWEQPCDGGYAGIVVVHDGTATDPTKFLEGWDIDEW